MSTALPIIRPSTRMGLDMAPILFPSTRYPPRFDPSPCACRTTSAKHLVAQGVDAEATYQLIRDELALDGSPALNLASFVHTWMPKQADQLMMENISKNLIDQDEYPMTRTCLSCGSRSPELELTLAQRSSIPVVCLFSPICGMRPRPTRRSVPLLPALPRLSNSEVLP